MSAERVTVAVATCGKPQYLARCVRAIAAQTRAPDEVIVVDQAPAPRARSIVSAAGARYLEQPRLGLSASRNLALRWTATELLAVTDDDCAPDPEWLATVLAALERAPRPGAVTGPILPLGERPAERFAVSLRKSETALDHRGRKQPWGVGSGANFAAPVDILRHHNGWDERLGAGSAGKAAEDADLLYRLLAEGAIVRYEPRAIVRHEWQTREHRLATRWSYGYGIGAMCGLSLARGDDFALRMLAGYLRLHVRPAVRAALSRDRMAFAEHARALVGPVPGLAYGLRHSRRPIASAVRSPP